MKTLPSSPGLMHKAVPRNVQWQDIKKTAVPRIGNGRGTLYVALSAIILAYGGQFGFVSILVFYAMWLPHIYFKKQWILFPSRDVMTVMLLPALACVSVIWSEFRPLSIYSACEYTSLILCTIVMAKTVRTVACLRGMAIGSAVVLLASVQSGYYGVDPFSGYSSLVGYFGSKNQVGLFAEIGIFVSLLCLFIRQNIFRKCLYGFFPLTVGCATLYMSKSASSMLSLAITFCIIMLTYFITRLPQPYRMMMSILAAVCCGFLFVVGALLNVEGTVLQSFGKDSTLTGRTLLWDRGTTIGMEKPVLGHGYSAFWVQGNLPAEKLWYEFEIPGRGGFHFHNLYIEVFVELGAVGVLCMVMFMWQNCFRSFALALRNGLNIEYVFALGVACMFLIRSFVEVDLIGTFGIGPFLFFALIPRLAAYRAEQSEQGGTT